MDSVWLGKLQQTQPPSPDKSVEPITSQRAVYLLDRNAFSLITLCLPSLRGVLQFSTNLPQQKTFSPIIDSNFPEPHCKNVDRPLRPAPARSTVETEENETGTNPALGHSPL